MFSRLNIFHHSIFFILNIRNLSILRYTIEQTLHSNFYLILLYISLYRHFIIDMKILLIDNHDSFTYNLLHLIRSVISKGDQIDIILNDKLELDSVAAYDRIIISPGPGLPSEATILSQVIKIYGNKIPILGICLGHQAIAESYGATIYNLPKPTHGLESEVEIQSNNCLFRGIANPITVGRYHSWSVSTDGLPDCLAITAMSDDSCIMSISHREYPVYGVQFHPESFLTPNGKAILSNFLNNVQV